MAVDEAGAIIDDGLACRMAEDHLCVTTTTGAADRIYRSMLWWNIFWGLDVDITNVTRAYAAMTRARWWVSICAWTFPALSPFGKRSWAG